MPSNAARLVVTVATVWYGFVPMLLADLNPTHLFNPNWTPHARMHLSWLLSAITLLATYALVLIWRFKRNCTRSHDRALYQWAVLVATLTQGFTAGCWCSRSLCTHLRDGN